MTSLDAAPKETDVLSGLASIDAGEITVDEITASNLTITNQVFADVENTDFRGLTNVFRLTGTQIGIGTNNPTNEFQIGESDFIINRIYQTLYQYRVTWYQQIFLQPIHLKLQIINLMLMRLGQIS